MTIRNLHWELEAKFTRKQIIAMAKVAAFVGNIQKDLVAGFPSSCNEIDWEAFRQVMGMFSRLGEQDTLAYRALVKTVEDVNGNRVQLLSGKVVEREADREID